MNALSLLRGGALLVIAGLAACSDTSLVPDAPLAPTSPSAARAPAGSALTDANVSVHPIFAEINGRLAAAGSNIRAVKAELLLDGKGWDGATSTVIIANNRSRGIGSEWVKGDPRREGRQGVTYAIGSNTSILPTTRDPDGSNVRLVSAAQVEAQIEEGMAAWRDLRCSSKPITRVPVPAGTDPDYLDQLFRGNPAGSPNYVQPADIVQSGWQPLAFFTAFGGAAGANIIGVTFTFVFVDDVTGARTDIDGNGQDDLALAELYYNNRFYWGTSAAPNVVDFYSIITHESGHALGLGHFGKVFVTKKAAADGIQIADVKYAPYAMMNAVYVTGRNELTGTDNGSFCQIWASR